jgi:ribulose-5-phosphate 4-epimerase/fuculose-1-phosphate aldolase
MNYYDKLFEHLSKEHGLILLESEMQDIVRIVHQMEADYEAECIADVIKIMQDEKFEEHIKSIETWIQNGGLEKIDFTTLITNRQTPGDVGGEIIDL